MALIHPSAVVDPNARLADNVEVGPPRVAATGDLDGADRLFASAELEHGEHLPHQPDPHDKPF